MTAHGMPPRRRGQSLVTAILDAAWAELEESGYAELTIERVAERARASKASIYRRWPGKPQLVYAAAHRMFPDRSDVPDTGTLRGDLLALVDSALGTFRGPAGIAIRGLLADSLTADLSLGDLRLHSAGTSARVLSTVLERAVARGQAPRSQVARLRLEAGLDLLRFRLLFTPDEIDEDFTTELVDEVMLPLLLDPAAGTEQG